MEGSYFEQFAKSQLEKEREITRHSTKKTTGVLLTWRRGIYFGTMQEVYPEYDGEIVLITKYSKPFVKKLVDVVKKLDPERLEFTVDNKIIFRGTQYLLRRVGNELTIMTSDQTSYSLNHPLDIKVV